VTLAGNLKSVPVQGLGVKLKQGYLIEFNVVTRTCQWVSGLNATCCWAMFLEVSDPPFVRRPA